MTIPYRQEVTGASRDSLLGAGHESTARSRPQACSLARALSRLSRRRLHRFRYRPLSRLGPKKVGAVPRVEPPFTASGALRRDPEGSLVSQATLQGSGRQRGQDGLIVTVPGLSR
jgi:hypothetical protein